ncbi:hypothetical protein C2E20_3197 [Micractinium conductrix]|uniref:Uncharacterized protein n=1 Tax=Micractinium conductrix TaxID=554055 RepID=A0A2P6VIA3_9CHLO|nr:hypothetical protein C2E20_3197 [Micractinium conductrix]|eukprot:PSC73823.1 hypothetical protein C2E20_3197 [Micractinium conductrix]
MEMQGSAKAELAKLWADLGEAPDEAVLDFLAAGLTEDDADEDELCDSLAGFSPAFGQLVPPQQRQAVTGLLQRVAALRAEAAPPAQQTVSVAAVAAQALSHLRSLSVSRDGGSSGAGSGASSDSEEQALLTPQTAAAVATLRELCALPDASDAWLAHVLSSRGGGDVEAAAAWMLECPDLAAAQAAWQAEAQARRAERERSKKAIVSRFQLQAVPDGGSAPPGKGRPPPLQAWGQAAGGGGGRGGEGSKVRYRDGMVATRAGQKYVVGKDEDWDGGSRGKVYTKGKRGKGFV